MASSNVTNTAVVPIQTRYEPYYDDYNEADNYYKILFRPGFAVQARELTQLATIQQVQTERIGRHIFENGSIVIGGQLSYDNAISLNLAPSFAGTDIDTSKFIGKEIRLSANNDVRAQVISAAQANESEPPTLMIKYLTGIEFGPSSTIKIVDEEVYANVAATNHVGEGITASISDGIFFISGYFVRSGAQTIIVDKYNINTNARVGLEFDDAIIDENQDTNLLDPAQESSNYQAPGAHRYKIDLVLARRSLDSVDDEKFIELSRVGEGKQLKVVKTPIYSELEETFARRTYDESGNYTVRPFKLSIKNDPNNASNLSMRLEAGKAYIFGYEFETISPEEIIVERPLDTEQVSLYDISTAYGNYITTTNIRGFIDFSTMPVVDIHCVTSANVDTTNANTYNSTKIGVTRIRNIMFDRATDTANGLTHVLRTYIFDSRLQSLSGTATGGSANTISMNTATFSGVNGAYNRAIVRILSGPGAGEQRTIVSYNGTTKTATVSPNFSEAPTSASTFSIDFTFKETESISAGSGGSTADIDISSKDDGTRDGNTIVREPTFNSLVFKFPREFIKTGLTGNNYQYRKIFSGRTFSGGIGSVTAGVGESFVGLGGLSDTIKLANYLVIVTNPGSSGFQTGQIVSFAGGGRTISVTGQTATLNANISENFTADIVATVEIDSGALTNPKAKTKVSANTVSITSSAADATIGNTSVYLAAGQVIITNPNKVPGGTDSLYIADIHSLKGIYDLNGATPTPGTPIANLNEVTSKYILDNGQRDTHYDHGGIILKGSGSTPKGPLLVLVDYYNHSAGTSDGFGYFSVDSYPNSGNPEGYIDIPSYTTNSGEVIRLSDAIDFRPKRQNATAADPYPLQGARIPTPNEQYTVTFENYLPRKDLIVLSKDRTFKYLKGISAQAPVPQNDPDDAMVLYRLDMPPYVLDPKDIVVRFVENKRYTMRDIGKLEQRIQNMEYYATLSMLEQNATDIVIRDVNGLERTKYGIVADKFIGHQFGDITNPDYRCSMDFQKGELRPFFNTTSHQMDMITGDTNLKKNGTTVTLNYIEEPFVVQDWASKAENVQPYLIARFVGSVKLFPDNDVWVDTDRLPDVVANLSGANDAWEQLATLLNSEVFGTEWNDWETRWTGSTTSRSTTNWGNRRETTTTTTTTGTQSRTGVETLINFDTITESLGDRVLDVSVIPYIRPRDVVFVGENLRPTREVFYFFDEANIYNYIQKPDVIKLTSNTKFVTSEGFTETITSGNNTGRILLSRTDTDGNTILFVDSTAGSFASGQTITGDTTGQTAEILATEKNGGVVVAATATTVTLDANSSSDPAFYTGKMIYLVSGEGLGQSANITAYNGTTKVATISPAWTTVPDDTTKYSIGKHFTTPEGQIAGVLHIPSTDALSFRTGERVLRIIDNNTNDLDNLTTRGEGRYVAQGIMQSKSSLSVSVSVPTVAINEISETRPVVQTTTRSFTTWEGSSDPLAQTFVVDSEEFPNGLFLSSVDLFFKSKDEILPVWVEIRPVVNGYPHASTILPFSIKTVYPEDVNISDLPSKDDPSTITTFAFDNPIYLEPGKEYALVVRTNSLNYETYVSELGKTQIGTDRLISEQPYLGSLFKSQNASTWTPYQLEDLMMVLNKCRFTTTPSTLHFVNANTSPTPMDWAYIQTNALALSNTSIDYAFRATNLDGQPDLGFTSVNSDSNYRHNRRKIISSPGTMNLRAIIATSDPNISPMLDLTRYNVLAIENIVNNANLSNTSVIITNGGTGFTSNTNTSVTITGGDSRIDANAYVSSVASGAVTGIEFDNPGAYYTGSANISISGGGTGATAMITSELDPKGGPALSKYITRKVILNEGFDAGDLRVYLTAYKPINTDFAVYFKIKNADDPTPFENRPYIKMTQVTPLNRYSSSTFDENDLIEYEFRADPDQDQITYNSGSTTFKTFNEFSVKIVLLADDPIVVPVVKNMRAIALPGTE